MRTALAAVVVAAFLGTAPAASAQDVAFEIDVTSISVGANASVPGYQQFYGEVEVYGLPPLTGAEMTMEVYFDAFPYTESHNAWVTAGGYAVNGFDSKVYGMQHRSATVYFVVTGYLPDGRFYWVVSDPIDFN